MKKYVFALSILVTLTACSKAFVQVSLFGSNHNNNNPAIATTLQSNSGTAIYSDQNSMPIMPAFAGTVANAIPFSVQVVDQFGNAIAPPSPVTINFILMSGSGFISPSSATTDATGKASASYTAPTNKETAIISATGFGPFPAVVTITVSAGSVSTFSFGPTASFISATDNFRGVVYAMDNYGNVTPNYLGTPNLTWNVATTSPAFAAADFGRKIFSLAPGGQGTHVLSISDGIHTGNSSNLESVGQSGGTINNFDTAGNWATSTNWSLGAQPAAINQTFINNSCTLSGAGSVANLEVNSSFTNTGTLMVNGSDITVVFSATFSGIGGTINFNNSGWPHVQAIIPGSNPFNLGTITGSGSQGLTFSPGAGAVTVANLNVVSGAPVYINGNVTITSPLSLGTNNIIQVNPGGTLNLPNGIAASNPGARINVLGGGTLTIGNGSTLSASGGGGIYLFGTPSNPAVIDVYGGAGSYSMGIGPTGTFQSDFATIGHLANPGITTASTTTQFSVANTKFMNLLSNSTTLMLNHHSASGATMYGLFFDDSVNPGNIIPIDATNLIGYTSISSSTLSSATLPRTVSTDPSHLLYWDH